MHLKYFCISLGVNDSFASFESNDSKTKDESWTERELWILRDLEPMISFPSVFLKPR